MSFSFSDLCFALLFSSLTLTVHIRGIDCVWPQPLSFTSSSSSSSLSLDPSSFLIRTVYPPNTPIPRLDSAYARYLKIIFTDVLNQPNFRVDGDVLPELSVSVSSTSSLLTDAVDESYTLSINASSPSSPSSSPSALLVANSIYGALRGLETFAQLVTNTVTNNNNNNSNNSKGANALYRGKVYSYSINSVPLSINDAPRFKHRGLLIDTSRWFLPVSTILNQLDAMASCKLNVLHWHITDSQSFPLEIKSFPQLSGSGAYDVDRIYSAEDVASIVSYAGDRGIRVIPEIDAPGHTTSWGNGIDDIVVCKNIQPWQGYCNEPPCGQLNPVSDRVYEVLTGVWSDIASSFIDPYVHAGADEINFNCWDQDQNIKDYKSSHPGVTDHDLLQNFEDKEHQIITALGKGIINWEEVIIDFSLNISLSTVIQVWKGSSSVAPIAEKGYKVIASPADQWYLDCGEGQPFGTGGGNSWCDPYKTWQTIYNYDPVVGVSAAFQSNIIGGEVAAWSETIDESNIDNIVWPRAAAAAERLWSRQEQTDLTDALKRINQHRQLLVKRGIRARPLQPEYCVRGLGSC